MAAVRLGRHGPRLLVAAAIVIASSDIVFKYGRLPGLICYALAVFAAVGWGLAPLLARAGRLSETQALVVAATGIVALLVIVLVVYPIANVHSGGRGSDGDDMLRQGATALLHLRYPYYEQTYLGNPFSVLPGAFVLAIPFVLLGSVALANVFWTAVLFVVVRWQTGNSGVALALVGGVVALSPGVWEQYASGTDRFSNGAYVLAALVALLTVRNRRLLLLAAAALGLALSTRATLLAFAPIAFVLTARAYGWRTATTAASVTVGVFVVLLAPFAIYDAGGLSPITVTTKDKLLLSGVPEWLYVGIIAGVVAFTMVLALRRTASTADAVRNCVEVYLAAFGTLTVAACLYQRALTFDFAAYATAVLPFAMLVAWFDARPPGRSGDALGAEPTPVDVIAGPPAPQYERPPR